jgi:putative endonuclease
MKCVFWLSLNKVFAELHKVTREKGDEILSASENQTISTNAAPSRLLEEGDPKDRLSLFYTLDNRCMSFQVYVLYSSEYNKIYIGCTSDLESRFKSHNELGTKGWTIKFRPWLLVYTKFFETKAEAMRREKQLKSARGREFIRKEILKQ